MNGSGARVGDQSSILGFSEHAQEFAAGVSELVRGLSVSGDRVEDCSLTIALGFFGRRGRRES